MMQRLSVMVLFWILASCTELQTEIITSASYSGHEHQVKFLGKPLAPVDSPGFHWAYLGDSIEYRGVTGYQYLFIDREVEDTLLGWWGTYQDTLYYWSHHSYVRRCEQIVPFAVLDLKSCKYNFCEKECYEYRELTLHGNCVMVSCNRMSKNSDAIEVKHLLYTTSTDHEKNCRRTYHISANRGIIFYKSDFNPDSTTINFPY